MYPSCITLNFLSTVYHYIFGCFFFLTDNWQLYFYLSPDCRLNGRLISLGEPVIGVARSSCETCFCINGQVRCDKVICPPIRAQISPNCGPVYSEGHCCPTSYNCTTAISNGTYRSVTLKNSIRVTDSSDALPTW